MSSVRIVTDFPEKRLQYTAISFELLVFVGQLVAPHEQEFGPEQTDSVGFDFARGVRIAGKLDVRIELDADSVQRRGGRGLEPAQFGAFEFEHRLAQPVLFEHPLVRIDDQDATGSIDDQHIVVADHVADMVEADNGRDREATRDDRGMRSRSADVGHEAGDLRVLELYRVGRREVVRDDDRAQSVASLAGAIAGMAQQSLDQAFDQLHDVGLALAQIGVLDRVELVDQHFHLLHQRPFGVAASLADMGASSVDEQRVLQEHLLQFDEDRDFRMCAGWRLAQLGEFGADRRDRFIEPFQLLGDRARRDGVVMDFQQGVRDQLGMADGDALGNRQTVQREGHRAIRFRRSDLRRVRAARRALRRRRSRRCLS